MKEYNPNEKPIKLVMKPFSSAYIAGLMDMPLAEIWECLGIIAEQNDLNLCYMSDFEKCRDILYKSVILN